MNGSGTQFLVVILGSAAVGALISNLFTVAAQWRERKSRREELALTKAVEMAYSQVTAMLDMFKETGQSGKIAPPLSMVEGCYKSLKHILDHDELDPETKAKIADELRRHAPKP